MGFLQPTSGTISINRKDITRVSFDSLRKKIGYVSQRTFLFNDTIKRNVAYSLPDSSDRTIIAACKAAHAHEFIQQILGTYNALVGEDAQINAESDTTTVYDLTGTSNQITEIDISAVFSSLAAGHYCGIQIDHNGIGGTIEYIGIRIRYT